MIRVYLEIYLYTIYLRMFLTWLPYHKFPLVKVGRRPHMSYVIITFLIRSAEGSNIVMWVSNKVRKVVSHEALSISHENLMRVIET